MFEGEKRSWAVGVLTYTTDDEGCQEPAALPPCLPDVQYGAEGEEDYEYDCSD